MQKPKVPKLVCIKPETNVFSKQFIFLYLVTMPYPALLSHRLNAIQSWTQQEQHF